MFAVHSLGQISYVLKDPPPSKEEKEKKEKKEKEKKKKDEEEKDKKEVVRYIGLEPGAAWYQSSDPRNAPIINFPPMPTTRPIPQPSQPHIHHNFYPNAATPDSAGYGAAVLQAVASSAARRQCTCATCAAHRGPATPWFPPQMVPFAAPPAGEQVVRCREKDGSWTIRTAKEAMEKVQPGQWRVDTNGRPVWWAM